MFQLNLQKTLGLKRSTLFDETVARLVILTQVNKEPKLQVFLSPWVPKN